MPSSFKRRELGQARALAERTAGKATEAPLPEGSGGNPIRATADLAKGLRPCPFPSPVPLFSTGLASLDDLVCGFGLPSSSLIAFCPAIGLTSISPESGFGGAASDEAHLYTRSKPNLLHTPTTSKTTIEALYAAEQTLTDLIAYSVAQGLVSGQHSLVIGQGARDLVENIVPARATARDGSTPAPAKADFPMNPSSGENDDGDKSMKIAFRYAHRPKFKTTVDEPTVSSQTPGLPAEHLFRAPFDMTKRLTHQEIAAAQERECAGVRMEETTKYDEALALIEAEARKCLSKAASTTAPNAPVMRIHLLALGSPAWGRASDSMDRRLVRLSRFLSRLRRLVKHLVLERERGALHTICSVTLSSALLKPPWRTLVTQHLLRFFDAEVLLSDFSQDSHLRRAYAGYGGSICLLKGPSIAALLPPGEHRSVLRGGGGEAGVENDVGWRRRKRGAGIVFETLHEDVDAATQTDGPDEQRAAKKAAAKKGDDIEEAASGLHRRARLHTHASHDRGNGDSTQQSTTDAIPSPARPTAPPRFRGLQSLRERGLRATKQVDVDMEERDSN